MEESIFKIILMGIIPTAFAITFIYFYDKKEDGSGFGIFGWVLFKFFGREKMSKDKEN